MEVLPAAEDALASVETVVVKHEVAEATSSSSLSTGPSDDSAAEEPHAGEAPQGGKNVPTLNGDASAVLEPKRAGVEVLDPLSSPVFGAGDTKLDSSFLSVEEADTLLHDLLKEVDWQQWYHQPDGRRKKAKPEPLRRLKIAAANRDPSGKVPWYRFPVNNQREHGITTPMPAPVERLRKQVVAVTGVDYNHAVVLLYRGPDDCIGFHKDKTLDLDEDSSIVSVSLGRERPYVLRDDIFHPTKEQEVVLPHGTLLLLGPKTNTQMYHSVRKLAPDEPVPLIRLRKETDVRVSVTFRKVMTYVDSDWQISGQGSEFADVNWPVALRGRHVPMLGEDLPANAPLIPDASQH